MHSSPVSWNAQKGVEVEHLLAPGAAFTQTADDLLHHTLIMSPTGGGKTEGIINNVLSYLVRLQEESGCGGLVIDPVGGVSEGGFTGSLNLEAFCDGGVFAADAADSTAFNPLRAGGAHFAQSLWRADELLATSDSNYYALFGLRHVQSFTDLLLWVEGFIREAEEMGARLAPYPVILRRASVKALMDLLAMNKSGENQAQAIDALIAQAKKRETKQPEALDLDVFYDHLRACKAERSRSEQTRSLANAINRLYQLRAAYQSRTRDLLNDSDPAKAITVTDAVEGGKIVGFRLPSADGFPRIQLARCILRLYADAVLARKRPDLRTVLVLDEAAVFADLTLADLLAQGRKCGSAAVLAFQTREQFAQSEGLLSELWQNSKNHWVIPPLSPEEAAYYEAAMGTFRYSRFEKSVSYAKAPGDEKRPAILRRLFGERHTYTSHNISEREVEEPLYNRHWLSSTKYKALFRGLTHGELKTGVVKLSPTQPPTSKRVGTRRGGGAGSDASEVRR